MWDALNNFLDTYAVWLFLVVLGFFIDRLRMRVDKLEGKE